MCDAHAPAAPADTLEAEKNVELASKAPSEAESTSAICRICWEDLVEGADYFQPCRCRGTQRWVHRSCFQTWTKLSAVNTLKCPTCGYQYRRVVRGSWAMVKAMLKEAGRWIVMASYFIATRGLARQIYKGLLTDARDGRPFSMNIFWPTVYLMDIRGDPHAGRLLFADSCVAACTLTFKRGLWCLRTRVPLVWPPPVLFPSIYQEFGCQIFKAWSLRLMELVLILHNYAGSASLLRCAFDASVNLYAFVIAKHEAHRSLACCLRDSTHVVSYKSG
ncbi:marchf5 [Symbiodinium natans]|uniref:Marchf5 protein n=1 Tax=Symbiodinium natans TaxID=878477 RepID=A0A812PSM7_9DINO|nr:marchf5 [Symbiodinium natans]